MSRKAISSELIDYAERLYGDGRTIKEISEVIGVSRDIIARRLRERGIDPTRNARKRPTHNTLHLCTDSVRSMYENGMSENAVAKAFDVSRNVIRRHLIAAGVPIRTQSQAEALKWSQMTDEQRHNQVSKAHDAVTGMVRTHEEMVARAKAREKITSEHHIGIGEPEFHEFLTNIGRPFTYQKAVDVYNIDFAIGTIAVELTAATARYGVSNTAQNERAEKLTNLGYKMLAVVIDDAETLIQCAEDILAFIDEIDRLEPVSGQYRVIRCRRQDYTIVTNDRGQFTSVPVPVHFVNERRSVKYGA